jgi:hypothetical protein
MTKTFSSNKFAIGYSLLLILALILRFHQLNIPMLGEQEASIALQAAGRPVNDTFQAPGLVALLAPVLFLLGKSETAARLIPAVFGTALIFAPFFFKRQLGNKTAIALSILLMFDPSFAAFSRQVNGTVISVCGFVIAAAFLLNRKFIGAGIAAGFALIASPFIWPGILAVWLAFVIAYRRDDSQEDIEDDSLNEPRETFTFEKNDLLTAAIALAVTLVLIGSAFLTRMCGIAAPFLNLSAYLQGWFKGSGVPASLMLLSFILYQPFVLFSGLYDGFRALKKGDRTGKFLFTWFFFSLLLTVIYSSRGFDSLVFVFIPLLALSARCIIGIIEAAEKPDLPAYGQMVLTILLIPFSWMNILAVTFPVDSQEEALRIAAAAGGLLLLVIATILIRMGWPSKQCWTGLWLGLAIVIGVFTVSTAWRSTGLGKNPQAELWNFKGVSSELDLLQKTAGDLSEFNVSSRTGINIVVLNYPSSALKWALRDFTSVNDARVLPSLSNPAIVITENQAVPSLAKAYRGQDFAITRQTSWDLILPEEWIKWIAWREAPSDSQQAILWARTDLFPGAEKTAPATISPVQ